MLGAKVLAAEGLAIAGGFVGGAAGSILSQYLEIGEIDFVEALEVGTVNGITSGFAGIFSYVPSGMLLASDVGAIETATGIIVTLINEIIADFSSSELSKGGT